MLYTKKGDKGTTKTLKQGKGVRISKASCETEALGALDELNSFLGIVKSKAAVLDWKVEGESPREILHKIQANLFIVQAEVAGADKTIKPSKVGELEVWTDVMEERMPPIKSFFLPGASEMSAFFDVARTLARRAERRVTAAVEAGEVRIGEHTAAYLNRLSSVLYAFARLANHEAGIKEEPPSYE